MIDTFVVLACFPICRGLHCFALFNKCKPTVTGATIWEEALETTIHQRVVLAQLIVLLTFILGVNLESSRAYAADKIRLGKAQGGAWTFLPANVGLTQGLFAKYGLDVEVIDLAGDAKLQQAFAADAIDIGLGSGPGLAFVAKGSPAIGVAAFAGAPKNISATVLIDSPITSVDELKGKLVSVSTVGSLSDWLAKQMAIVSGWGPDGIKTIALGAISNSVSALLTHQTDGAMLATEASFQLEEQKKSRFLVGMDKYALHFITHVVYAQRKLVASDPQVIEHFLKAFFASIALVKTNKQMTSDLSEQILHQSPTVASRTYDYEVSMLLDDGRFDPQAVEVLRQSFLEMGVLDNKPNADQLFTTQFLPVRQ
jgi:NitT/TauT family transport system substrate-binding protein